MLRVMKGILMYHRNVDKNVRLRSSIARPQRSDVISVLKCLREYTTYRQGWKMTDRKYLLSSCELASYDGVPQWLGTMKGISLLTLCLVLFFHYVNVVKRVLQKDSVPCTARYPE